VSLNDEQRVEIFRGHFYEFGFPESAIEWLLMLWHVTQVFDDFADGDAVGRENLDKAIYYSLVGMNANSFYSSYRQELTPVVANFILKWNASDTVERQGNVDERSFMWRAAYYDVIMMVVLIVHGFEKAKKIAPFVMNLYGESFDDYKKEFE
jgi:hypothetical protein